jgi:Holliday junction resolvase-like predicted endonuclease
MERVNPSWKNVFRHPSEEKALLYLLQNGHILLDHNRRLARTEVDLITIDPNRVVHFIEVKAWKSDRVSHPMQSQHRLQRNRMRVAALTFLANTCFWWNRSGKSSRDSAISQGDGQWVELLDVSFDLIWLHPESDLVEYSEQIF